MSFEHKNDDMVYIAENIFRDIYPVIAAQIVQKTGVSKGKVLDIGTGSGALARALYELGDFEIVAIDSKIDMCDAARDYILVENKPIKVLNAFVECMPFDDSSFDLIISRGSVFFWKDKVASFKEIYRVLKEGGITYIGGGFGTKELASEISKIMESKYPEWKFYVKKRMESVPGILNDLATLGLPFELIDNETGIWIMIRK
ncbi:class I SAM-dependent methyltransferase [Hydrogenobaculum acidophilum]